MKAVMTQVMSIATFIPSLPVPLQLLYISHFRPLFFISYAMFPSLNESNLPRLPLKPSCPSGVVLEQASSTVQSCSCRVELILQIDALKPAVERQINSSFIPYLLGDVRIPDVVCTSACIPRPVFILHNLLPFYIKLNLWAMNLNARSAFL